jgi:hypothetical protein
MEVGCGEAEANQKTPLSASRLDWSRELLRGAIGSKVTHIKATKRPNQGVIKDYK